MTYNSFYKPSFQYAALQALLPLIAKLLERLHLYSFPFIETLQPTSGKLLLPPLHVFCPNSFMISFKRKREAYVFYFLSLQNSFNIEKQKNVSNTERLLPW